MKAMNLVNRFTTTDQKVEGKLNSTDNPYAEVTRKEMKDQFMVGDNLLVAPLFTGETSRKVILPEGKWYDIYTGKFKILIMRYLLVLLSLFVFVLYSVFTPVYSQTSDFKSLFMNPPHMARLQAMWFWQGANFSKEGITKDLEAMHSAGLGAVLILNVNSTVENVPWPENKYRSNIYWDALLHAAKEADRLGMTIGLANAPGYCGTGGPWIKEDMNMRRLVWSEAVVDGGKEVRINLAQPTLSAKAGKMNTSNVSSIYDEIAVLAVPLRSAPIQEKEVFDLSAKKDKSGAVVWNAPTGKWKIFRIGYVPTMAESHPLPDDVLGRSFEADKFDPEVSRYHWKNVIDPIKQRLGKYYGKSFTVLHIDSYESGTQNWSRTFREEFIKRKGYDPVPWLVSMGSPVLGFKPGQYNGGLMDGLPPAADRTIIGSSEQTKRFEWDFCDLVGRLFTENIHIGVNAVRKDGLKFSYEPYAGPFNTLDGAAMVDIPMCTFWTHINGFDFNSTNFNGNGKTQPLVSGAARAANKQIIASESFTGMPRLSRFDESPAKLKYLVDGAFTSGVNQLMLHQWVHQPFDDKYQPGMCNNYWGTHFSRYQTWFEPGKAFFNYVLHSQAILQHGRQVIDCLTIDSGNDYYSDYISSYDFVNDNTTVEGGLIKLGSGRSYYYVIYPDKRTDILPEVAAKLKRLALQGAVVAMPMRWSTSPGMQDYPHCDQVVKEISDEMFSSPVLSGKVVRSIKEAKDLLSLTDDFTVMDAQEPDKIEFVHRTDGKEDIYFVTNRSEKSQNVKLKFRVAGKQPEIWDANRMSITDAPVWTQDGKSTDVSLFLGSREALFVAFRRDASNKLHPTAVKPLTDSLQWQSEGDQIYLSKAGEAKITYNTGQEKIVRGSAPRLKSIEGSWDVAFAPKLGEKFNARFDKLEDWSKNTNENIRYFSGTATYTKTFKVEADMFSSQGRIELDLGNVYDIARVKINDGKYLTLWYMLFKTDITEYLKPGMNSIEIEVTNTWANALIGDERFPADFEKRTTNVGYFVKEFPDWFFSNQKRPSARKTFSTFNYYDEKSELHPAGLVGPVSVCFISEAN